MEGQAMADFVIKCLILRCRFAYGPFILTDPQMNKKVKQVCY